jgi:hypothetical protein
MGRGGAGFIAQGADVDWGRFVVGAFSAGGKSGGLKEATTIP